MSGPADANVTTLRVRPLKVALPLAPDQVPRGIDPADPRLVLDLGGLAIAVTLNPKAVRKLLKSRRMMVHPQAGRPRATRMVNPFPP